EGRARCSQTCLTGPPETRTRCARPSASTNRRKRWDEQTMPRAIVTGSGGLIGSESATHLVEAGYDVVGIENDTRAVLFGPEASTAHVTDRLNRELTDFRTASIDIRDSEGIDRVFAEGGGEIELVVHTAAQPSHDWAASDPQADFGINANG